MVSNEEASISCLVPGCNNATLSCPEKTFFQFSAFDERCQHWLLVCKREDLLVKRNSNINEHFAVCSDHFIGDHFEDKFRRKLKENAVPTLFPFDGTIALADFDSSIKALGAHSLIIEGTEVYIKTELEDDEYDIDEDRSDEADDQYFTIDEVSEDSCDNLNPPQQLCRLCANSAPDMVYIFSDTGEDLDLANKINISLPVTVKKTDPLPKQLCISCIKKMDMCAEFAESCIEAERKLITMMKLKHFRTEVNKVVNISDLQLDPSTNSTSLHSSNSNTDCIGAASALKIVGAPKVDKIAITSDNENELLNIDKEKNLEEEETELTLSYSCPLCCEGNVTVEKSSQSAVVGETVNSKELLQNNDTKLGINKFSELENGLIICRENNSQESVSMDSSNADSNVQDGVMCDTVKESVNSYTVMEGAPDWWKVDKAMESSDIVLETVNPDSSRDCQMLEYKDANGDSLTDYESFVQLEDEEGDQDEERIFPCCYICGTTFSSIKLCLAHSKCHFDVQYFPCSYCGNSYSNEINLAKHCDEHRLDGKEFKRKGKRITCDTCFRRFNGEKTFFSHSCIAPETKHFRCLICKKSYSTEERLSFHQKFHEGARLNYCNQCGKEFDNEGSLYYHTRMVHEGERPFGCNLCSKRFYSNSRLVAHKRVHTGERPFECEMCGRRFYDRETLKGHYVTHMSVKPYQCDLCGICWGRRNLLNQHLRTHHSDSQLPRRTPSLIHYFCKACQALFTGSTEVLSHRTSHWNYTSTDGEHTCEFCGQSFLLVSDLGKHRKQEHPDERPYVCSVCKETSHTLYEARQHRKVHTDCDPKIKTEESEREADNAATLMCDTCGTTFTERRKFVKHLKEHRTDKTYQCKVCEKQFGDNQRLTVHMRLHTGEKPYPCPVCHKRFSQTSALYTHALLHTGEKPHTCDLCGKAFRIKADRDNHRRTHTGEKPYKCEFCGKAFRTGQVYYQHRMIHTDERRFPCDICGKAFRRSHTLVVHKLIHTGEKPNICDVCGKGFRQRSDMKKHRALHGSPE